MNNIVRSLLLCVAMVGFGVAGAADTQASDSDVSVCFAPSVFPGAGGLLSELGSRASCIWNHLVGA